MKNIHETLNKYHFIVQKCLILMSEKSRKFFDQKGNYVVLLAKLQKCFNDPCKHLGWSALQQ